MKDVCNTEEYFIYDFTKAYLKAQKPESIVLQSPQDMDWNRLSDRLRQHKLYQLAYRCLSPHMPIPPLPEAEKVRFTSGYFRHYRQEIMDIARLLQSNGLHFLLIKGVTLSKVLFDSYCARDIGDIDLIIHKEDAEKTYELLTQSGYGQENHDSFHKMYGYYHHEILLYKEVLLESGASATIWLELKWGSSAFKYHFPQLFEYTQSFDFDGCEIQTLDANATLLHLLVNTYVNNESVFMKYGANLRDYFETALFIHKYGGCADWKLILALSKSLECQHKIYDVMNSIHSLYGLPVDVLENWLPLFSPEHCPYRFGFEDFFVDKNLTEKNDGLSRPRHRLHPLYRIFHIDSALYYSYLSYKAALYSKKNRMYQEREPLKHNEDSRLYHYEQELSPVWFHYCFGIRNRHVKISFTIPSFSEAKQRLNEKMTIRLVWYDNDVQSSCWYYFVDIPILYPHTPAREEYSAQTNTKYHKENLYHEELQKKEKALLPFMVERRQQGEQYQIRILFDRDNWFEYLDIVYFETAVMLMTTQDGSDRFSYGADAHMVEFVEGNGSNCG
ncbi:MAG: nucleotidyltransferase family protein [Clostridium sp.]|jgi:hypothetical protein|nr:nucleotidyltransferase family protein [Clostridium sp.]